MANFIHRSTIIAYLTGLVTGPVLLAAGLYLLYYLYTKNISQTGDSEGLDPPDFPTAAQVDLNWKVQRLDGMAVSMTEFTGRVLFLNFWATWCGPCRAEMPTIEKLYAQFKDRVIFACISNEDAETLKAFQAKHGYRFPIYKISEEVPKMLQTTGIPATFIIDRSGRQAFKHIGGADWSHASVAAFLEDRLRQDSPASAGR